MHIHLTPELEKLVQDQVKSCGYDSASEVVRDAILLLAERERIRQCRLAELTRKLDAGLDQLDRGEAGPLDIEAIKSEGRKRLTKRRKGA